MSFTTKFVSIITDFILLEYNGMGSQEGLSLMGINSSGDLINTVKPFLSVNNYSGNTKINIPKKMKVLNIVSCGVKNNKPAFKIVTFKNSETPDLFHNKIYDENNKESFLKLSKTLPFVVTDFDMLSPLLGFSEEGNLIFYAINEKNELDEIFKMEANLAKNHTSAFIDLSGDLRPNLGLIEFVNNQKFLKIYDFYRNKSVFLSEIPLPNEIGPTLYADLNKTNRYDLIYISIENNESFLNIHLNKAPCKFSNIKNIKDLKKSLDEETKKNIYSNSPTYKINLRSYIDGIAVIKNEDQIPTGLFLADLNMSGEIQIFITVKNKNQTKLRCFKYENGNILISPFDAILSEYTNIISVSSADINDSGSQGLLINFILNGKPVLLHKKITPPQENTKLTSITNLSINEKDFYYLPGATYIMLYDSGKKFKKSSQFVHSSFPSLQHKGVYVGLGSTNLFLDYIIVRTNSTNEAYDMFKTPLNVIVPNSSIKLSIAKPNWSIQSFYGQGRYNVVFFCLCCLFFFNLFVLIWLTFLEKSASKKKTETDENIMIPVFKTL